MIGNADTKRESQESKFERLKKILKEFKYYPPTGYGKVLFEIEFYNDEVRGVTPKTDIETEFEEMPKVSIHTRNSPNENKQQK